MPRTTQQRTRRPDYGKRIEDVLEAQGRRKDWLAAKLKMHPTQLSKILAGAKYYQFTKEQKQSVAEALAVPPSMLFDEAA